MPQCSFIQHMHSYLILTFYSTYVCMAISSHTYVCIGIITILNCLRVDILWVSADIRTAHVECSKSLDRPVYTVFLEKMLRLLFISALPQCGDYSRAATIRSTDVAATIYFSATAMRRLFEGGYYSKYRRRGYYLFQCYHYSRAATIRGAAFIQGNTEIYTPLFIQWWSARLCISTIYIHHCSYSGGLPGYVYQLYIYTTVHTVVVCQAMYINYIYTPLFIQWWSARLCISTIYIHHCSYSGGLPGYAHATRTITFIKHYILHDRKEKRDRKRKTLINK